MRHRLVVAARVACVLLLAASPGLAEPPEAHGTPRSAESASAEQRARDLYDLGARQYEAGSYADAARAFRSAYDLTPVPALLYNLAQAERLAGDCAGALRDYQAFEAAHVEPVPPDLAGKAEEMDRCVRAAKPPEKKPEKATGAVSDTGKARTPQPRPIHHETRRALGYGVAAGAVTAGVLGAVFAVRMHTSEERLAEVNQPGKQWGPAYSSEQQSWEHSRNAMVGCFAASGLLAAGATFLFLGARDTAPANSLSALSLDIGSGRTSANAAFRFRF